MLQNILAALGVVLNGLPQGLMALAYGFKAAPTALGFAVGIVGCLVFGSVAPISFQAETIALAGTMGKNMRERLSMVIFAGLGMVLLGAFGLLNGIVEFAGEAVVLAMMAGVGLMLAKVSIDMLKDDVKVGAVSMAAALLVYLLTTDLVYTIVASVVLSSVANYFFNKGKHADTTIEREKFKLVKPTINFSIARGTLALMCLTIGANIAFGGITGGIAGESVNIDHLTIYSGAADSISALFGGAPVEAIISATATAPNPILSGVLMMAIMGVILISGFVPKIGKYIPTESIAGFLFVLGIFATMPINAAGAFAATSAGAPIVAALTMGVTAMIDPFVGMAAGIALQLLGPLIGLF